MLSEYLHTGNEEVVPREGDLFKVIRRHGKSFEIRYGFYEERDRHGSFAEPMAIYPDFVKEPCYTEEGIPFATAIQVPCKHFEGTLDENSVCEECRFYQPCEELLGLCLCSKRRQSV